MKDGFYRHMIFVNTIMILTVFGGFVCCQYRDVQEKESVNTRALCDNIKLVTSELIVDNSHTSYFVNKDTILSITNPCNENSCIRTKVGSVLLKELVKDSLFYENCQTLLASDVVYFKCCEHEGYVIELIKTPQLYAGIGEDFYLIVDEYQKKLSIISFVTSPDRSEMFDRVEDVNSDCIPEIITRIDSAGVVSKIGIIKM